VGYICGLNGAYIKTNTFKGIISIAKGLGQRQSMAQSGKIEQTARYEIQRNQVCYTAAMVAFETISCISV
jgi:hypothetical protein